MICGLCGFYNYQQCQTNYPSEKNIPRISKLLPGTFNFNLRRILIHRFGLPQMILRYWKQYWYNQYLLRDCTIFVSVIYMFTFLANSENKCTWSERGTINWCKNSLNNVFIPNALSKLFQRCTLLDKAN